MKSFFHYNIFLATFFLLSIFEVSVAQENKLSFQYPANQWIEALPIGNGSIGAMIFGGVSNERIQFNEQSLVTGDKKKMGDYQPFGDLLVTFSNKRYANYKRILSLDKAVVEVSYSDDEVNYKREYFASYTDKVIVCRYTANKAGSINAVFKLNDAHNALSIVDNKRIIVSGVLNANGMNYESQVLILPVGGKLVANNYGIEVTKANSVVVLLTAGTDFVLDLTKNFRTDHPHQKLNKIIENASQISYDQLLKNHLTDYQSLYGRVKLRLGNDFKKEVETTSFKLDNYIMLPKGQGDIALEELLFNYGRYLMISSSRQGGLPINLQGLWNEDIKPAWYSQYTTDINIEMNYWLAEQTALSECHLPFFDWVENLAKVQKQSDDPKLKVNKGWIAYSTNNIMGGPSTWGLHRPGSAWLSQHFWEHYAFTGDVDFLRQKAFPMLKDVVSYWENHLVKREDGKLITPDGWSPEHGPGNIEGDRTPYKGVSYDQQIVYDLFTNYIEASEALNENSVYRKKIKTMRDKMLGPQIGKWGQLQEWMEDVDLQTDEHRHLSHLFAVQPGRQISPTFTPELAKAAKISLLSRGEESNGWSAAWRINIFARLFDSEQAYFHITQLMKISLHPNLFSMYPFNRTGPFQIDANLGYTSGVSEMLLQSHLKQGKTQLLFLLPALPNAWSDGSIQGLKTRGGCTVDQTWENGKLQNATIKASRTINLKVLYASKTIEITLKAGQKCEIDKSYQYKID